MYFPTTFAVLASLVPGILAQVTFTKPDVDKKLNLSAKSIVVAWTLEPDSQPAKESPEVDLWWWGDGFGYQLVANLSTAPGVTQFEWKPQSTRDAMLRSNITLRSSKDFSFELRFHERNSSRGSGFRSQKYAAEGYPGSTSGAGYNSARVGFVVMFSGLVGAAMVVLR